MKWPNFQRATTLENLKEICSNVNSNSFQDILLTSLKCPNLQSAITLEKWDGIWSKVNQVLYNIWLSFKCLSQIIFEKSCWKVWNGQFCKGPSITPKKKKTEFVQKLIRKSTHHPLSAGQVSRPWLKYFQDSLLTSLKCQSLQRALTPENFDGICSTENQIIYSWSPIR